MDLSSFLCGQVRKRSSSLGSHFQPVFSAHSASVHNQEMSIRAWIYLVSLEDAFDTLPCFDKWKACLMLVLIMLIVLNPTRLCVISWFSASRSVVLLRALSFASPSSLYLDLARNPHGLCRKALKLSSSAWGCKGKRPADSTSLSVHPWCGEPE
jgi:hypothetical protein